MKTKLYLSILLAALFISGAFAWTTETVFSASDDPIPQLADLSESRVFGAPDYNARDEFSLTQGGTSGVWNYGFSTSATDNSFTQHTLTRSTVPCGGNTFEEWYRLGESFDLPSIRRNVGTTRCFNIPPETLILHPSASGRRAVLRWTAPASGNYLVNGLFNGLDTTTTDIKILKNAATVGEAVLFSGNIIGFNAQQPFNFAVTAAMGDTIDFSVGFGTNGSSADSTGLAVTVGPPVTACQTAPANLQVNVPAENSPVDVQSVNTNASLIGDATYTNTGKVGRAFSFDGNGDYVRIEDHPSQKPINQLTLEGWFKFNAVGGFQFLASKSLRGQNNRSYALWSSGGAIQLEYRSTSGSVIYNTGFAAPINSWTHYAMVVNTDDTGTTANTIKLYVNGVEAFSNAANDPVFYDGINNANVPLPFLIGGGFDGSNNPDYFFNGQADEVSVYGRALSQTEIFDLVKQGSFGKCPPANCAQTPNNLVSWFAGEQNALDSRSNNHGALQNGATFALGKSGQSFSFDGTNDYVAVPHDPTLNLSGDLTLEAWINPQITSGFRGIISKRSLDNLFGEYLLSVSNGRLSFASRNGGGFNESLSTATIPINTFTHVAATISGSTLKIYINGALDSTHAAVARPITTGRLTFGAAEVTSCGACDFWQGLIDEVSVYNRALSATEIASINSAGQSGKCKPSPLNPTTNQIAWFTGDGDTRDFTGLNPNGILRGDANYKVGKVGQSFNFDGNGDYVEVADDVDHKPTGQLTLEGWFRSNNVGSLQFLASKPFSGNGSIRSYALWSNPTLHIEYNSTSGSVLYNTGISPQSNIWTHYAMVINTDDAGATANTIKLYLNGAEAYTNTANNPITYGAAIPFLIGAGADSLNNPTFFFNGQADEVSLYGRALLASEIAAVYNAGVAGKLKSKATTVNLLPETESVKVTGKAREKSVTPASFAPTVVQLSDATVTFAQVTTAGTTSQYNLDLALLPPIPSFLTATGLNYDISTTATFTTATLCFNLPSINVQTRFANLRILHLEGSFWQDRTEPTSVDFATRTICTKPRTSLSPFVIAEGLIPSASNASVSGRIQTADGIGIRNAILTLTAADGTVHTSRSSAFGYYSFANVEAGQTVIVTVRSKRFSFAQPVRVVTVADDITDLDFIAEP